MRSIYSPERSLARRPIISSLFEDLRYTLRRLCANPAWTAVALFSLTLGIGINGAIGSLVDLLLLRDLPVAGAERLVIVNRTDPGGGLQQLFSYPTFRRFQGSEEAFVGVFAFTRRFIAVVRPLSDADLGSSGTGKSVVLSPVSSYSAIGAGETVAAQLVSDNFFHTLGVQAIVGRTFSEIQEASPHEQVALISYGYWERRFARSAQVIGSTISVNGAAVAIIGVTPPEFSGVLVDLTPDLYLPIRMFDAVQYSGNIRTDGHESPGLPIWQQPTTQWLEVMALCRQGVELDRAAAMLDVLFQREMPVASSLGVGSKSGRQQSAGKILLTPGRQGISNLRKRLAEPLLILMGLAALVLFSSCFNLANLLLASADSRHKEMAVRMSIGANRGRLIRQLVTESLMLSGAGAVFGLLVSYWGSRLLFTLIADVRLPAQLDSVLDPRKVVFASAMAIVTGLLFGLLPAFQMTRVNLNAVLKDTGGALVGAGGGRQELGRFSLRRTLVIIQIGMSLVLLVGAGLFTRSLHNLLAVETGFDEHSLLQMEISSQLLRFEDDRLLSLYRSLEESILSLPGVRSVSLSRTGLMSSHMVMASVSLPGVSIQEENAEKWIANETIVTPGYFETVGIPVLQGRGIALQDRSGAPEVAVINQTMARRFFSQGPIVGRHFGFDSSTPNLEVVGVVMDSKYNTLREEAPPMIYRPVAQEPDALRFVLIRTSPGAASTLAPLLRRAVAELEPELAVLDISPMIQQIERSSARDRAVAHLATFFGILALFLAGVGLYGLLSYDITRRTKEIGLRLALGASRGSVLMLILRDTLLLLGIGLAVGLVAALGIARLAANQLFGLSSYDPLTLSVASLILASVALFAAYLPASRAASVDPIIAMRHE